MALAFTSVVAMVLVAALVVVLLVDPTVLAALMVADTTRPLAPWVMVVLLALLALLMAFDCYVLENYD